MVKLDILIRGDADISAYFNKLSHVKLEIKQQVRLELMTVRSQIITLGYINGEFI